MSIKMKDVLDAIDHRGRTVHDGEMGLWVRASEWDLVREAMRHSPSEADQRDAARYRWWVENYGTEYDSPVSRKLYTVVPAFKGKLDTKERFDAAIDAAIAAAKPSPDDIGESK